MIVLNGAVLGIFFVAGMIVGAAAVGAVLFTGWCYRWPRGVWK